MASFWKRSEGQKKQKNNSNLHWKYLQMTYSAHSNYALFLGMLNRFDEAEKQFKLALEINP